MVGAKPQSVKAKGGSGPIRRFHFFSDKWKMRKKLSDGRIIAFLCAALVAEALLLLWRMQVNAGVDHNLVEGARRAGQVLSARNHLRRRGLNSLIWEPSQANETVYYHDSILTLEGSEALIQLEGGTEIHVSENTLVTVEPPEKRQSGEIRLKFFRGNLRARNPFVPAEVGAATLAMRIKPGSEIDLRQVNDEQFELRVQKGNVELMGAGDGPVVAGAGEFLRMEQQHVQHLRVNDDLDWVNAPPSRIYTHAQDVTALLKWKGSPERLIIQSLGVREQSVDTAGEFSKELRLPHGQHRLLLRSGERSSLPVDIQILKAPLIHLLSPLPRNRAGLDERILFQWNQTPGVIAHELHIDGRRTHLRERVNGSEHTLIFGEEEDVEWSVQGMDSEGFAIPPLYTYPLHLRASPLAAPKLKSPFLRRPAQESSRGAFWRKPWDLLLPRAYADDVPIYEALFSWEAVAGADQYVVEISETPDFREPLLVRTVRRNEYLWKGFSLKPYYWRVAAGSRSGRLGLFSEPSRVNLQEVAKGRDAVDGVVVRPVAPFPTPTLTPTAVPTPSSPPSRSPERRVLDARRQKRSVFWQPGYSHFNVQGDGNVSAIMSGLSPLSFRLEQPVAGADDGPRVDFTFRTFKFEPHPRDAYSFQGDIGWSQASVGMLWFNADRRWGYGAGISQRPRVARADYETVKVKMDWSLGPRMEASWARGRFVMIARGALAFSSRAAGGSVGVELRFPLWRRLIGGLGVEGEAYSGSAGGTVGAAQLSLGFEF
jgi:hypothetical protein